MSTLKVKKLMTTATLPSYGSAEAAALDLYAAEPSSIPAMTQRLVKTGIAVVVPEGTYGQIAGRSGLALKKGVKPVGGVIDRDYRGDVGVIIENVSDVCFDIYVGDRIAQLLLIKIERPTVEEVQDLDDTSRGDQGFGSTDTVPPCELDLSYVPLAVLQLGSHIGVGGYVVIGTENCGYCTKAIELLNSIDDESSGFYEYRDTSVIHNPTSFSIHFKTVPQIWYKAAHGIMSHVGGYSELRKHLVRVGHLIA